MCGWLWCGCVFPEQTSSELVGEKGERNKRVRRVSKRRKRTRLFTSCKQTEEENETRGSANGAQTFLYLRLSAVCVCVCVCVYSRRLSFLPFWQAQIYHARALVHAAKAVGARTATVKFVSVCPAWVGTNIAGDGFETTVVQALAFPPDQARFKNTPLEPNSTPTLHPVYIPTDVLF